jgi:hypothetical protein
MQEWESIMLIPLVQTLGVAKPHHPVAPSMNFCTLPGTAQGRLETADEQDQGARDLKPR